MNAPSLVPHVTIPSLARKLGQDRKTMFRRLKMLHAGDRRRGESHTQWLYRHSATGAWSVNLSRLYAEHPEMFEAPTPEELEARLAAVEEKIATAHRRLEALFGSLREHVRRHHGARTSQPGAT
jgi:hypothetical protein